MTLLVKRRRCITRWHVYILSTLIGNNYESPCVHARVRLRSPPLVEKKSADSTQCIVGLILSLLLPYAYGMLMTPKVYREQLP